MTTDVWIINGIPGAGKSTTAHYLAACQTRGVHIEGDKLQEFIVAGAVPPGGQPAGEEARQIHLNVRHQCLLARSFARAGFVPILDYVVVNRARLEEYRQQLTDGALHPVTLHPVRLHLVTLAPGVAVALQRDQHRPEKTVAAAWIHLDEMIRAELGGVGLWVDNSALSVEATVHYIVSNQARAEVY